MRRFLVEEPTRASSNRLGSDIVIRPAAAEVPCGERITESQECCGKEVSKHTCKNVWSKTSPGEVRPNTTEQEPELVSNSVARGTIE